MDATLLAITSTDERHWRAVIDGDTLAFESVVERYQGAVAGVAFSIIGEFTASQDVAQETFLTAWKSRAQLREPSRLGGWLCGIARNLAIDWVRKHHADSTENDGRLRETPSRELDPAEQTISAEEKSLVWASLEDLPEHYREVLVLFYRQGRAVAEVAAALDLSEDAVKQRLSRGREMIREQLAHAIEDVLVRSKPGRVFTSKVMAGMIGMGAALTSTNAATAATVGGKVVGAAISGTAATATPAVMATGAGAGLAGGIVGAAGGLGGAWLGTWLPSQLAPTLTERRFLEANGRRLLLVAIGYVVLTFGLTPLVLNGRLWTYFLLLGCVTVAFFVYTIVASVRVQRRVNEIRRSIRPEDDPNPSAVKAQLNAMHVTGTSGWKGRSYTSSYRLLGLPLVDVQVNDPMTHQVGMARPSKVARGWIAIGDRAQGILLGVGGMARGLVALGGIAYGGVAIGGVSLGLIGLGGLALGLLAVGGGAIGHTAVGGGALGWDAAGGLAVGWDSACGGLAVAKHVAVGGLAVAADFAVGGQAHANSVNNPRAQRAVAEESLQWMLAWYMQNQTMALAVIIGFSLAPIALAPLFYRRK